MLRLLVVCIFISVVVKKAWAWTCWLPDSTSFDNVGMIPCNSTLADTTAGSACCDPRDACTTNGMCLGESGYTYRGGCTDQAFNSNNCPSYCLTGDYTPWGKSEIQCLDLLTDFKIQYSIRGTAKARTSTAAVMLGYSQPLSVVALMSTLHKIVADPLSTLQDPDPLSVLVGTPKVFFSQLRTTALSLSLQPLRHPQPLSQPEQHVLAQNQISEQLLVLVLGYPLELQRLCSSRSCFGETEAIRRSRII